MKTSFMSTALGIHGCEAQGIRYEDKRIILNIKTQEERLKCSSCVYQTPINWTKNLKWFRNFLLYNNYLVNKYNVLVRDYQQPADRHLYQKY